MKLAPSRLPYEPHIDGLRAIAVISVVGFHVGFLNLFSGGYIGVDVFFVISGYLITRLIAKEIQLETFTFSEFYIRRLRRIFPALFFTIIVSFTVAIFLFSPQHLERLAGASIYSIMSISNIYFWQESGYFDTSASFKPLLHTWSLSIEEQFYLLWPALLLILYAKVPKRLIYVLIILIGISSLAISFFYQNNTVRADSLLQNDFSTIFYLLPFRIFEFVIGASLLPITQYKLRNIVAREILTVIGLLMIIYPVTYYTKEILFPSYNALLPCFGSAILIHTGGESRTGKVINNILFIKIGLISYSLYLSHWPIFVFYQYIISGDLDNFDRLFIILISIIVSIFMYSFIEQRYRHQSIKDKDIDNLRFALICSVISLISITLFAHTWAKKSWWGHSGQQHINTTGRLNKNEWTKYTPADQLIISSEAFHDYVWQRHLELEKPFYDHQKINVLIVGDSMAGDFVNTIMESKLNSESIEVRTIPIRYGCQSLTDIDDYSLFYKNNGTMEKCIQQHQNFRENIALQYADIIVLASFWSQEGIDQLPQTIRHLKGRNNAEIIVIGKKSLKLTGLKAYFQKRNTVSVNNHTLLINQKISQIKEPFLQINPTDFFCIKNKCPVADSDQYVYIYDTDHLTPKGAEKIGNLISETNHHLKKILKGP